MKRILAALVLVLGARLAVADTTATRVADATQALTDCTGPKGTTDLIATIYATLGDARSCVGTTSYFDFWTFTALTGQNVRVSISSRSFRPFIAIQDYNTGAVLAYDAGDSPVTFDYRVPSSGKYVLGIGSLDTFGTGQYQASVTEIFSTGGCTATSVTFCAFSNRFSVRANWSVPSQGTSGVGNAVPVTSDTGYFWFFSPSNVELVVKVLDGRPVNNKFWVFYGALSDVAYTITITDTATGVVRTYTNRQGTLASVADTSAF